MNIEDSTARSGRQRSQRVIYRISCIIQFSRIVNISQGSKRDKILAMDDAIEIPFYEISNFCLSNFSAHVIEFKGERYATAEHAFHAQKFEDSQLREQIKSCATF